MNRQFIVTITVALTLSIIIFFNSVSAEQYNTTNFNHLSTTNLSTIKSPSSFSSDNMENKVIEFTGVLSIFWIDSGLEFKNSNNNQEQIYYIIDKSGKYYQLLLSDEIKQQINGFSNLNAQKVTVTGTINKSKNSDSSSSLINVQKLSVIDDNKNALEQNKLKKNITLQTHIPTTPGSTVFVEHVSGNQKFVSLLCRFGDSTDFTPEPLSYAENLIDRVNQYYQDVSYNKINLDGSVVEGWYNMPEPRPNYFPEGVAFPVDAVKLINHCLDAANDDIFFPDYDGINLLFNQNLFGVTSFGNNEVPIVVDGISKLYRITLMSLFHWHNQDVLAHEMGHSFGLPHSSGPYVVPYDSNWDVMSSTFPCIDPNQEFRCHGPHIISFYKYAIGWIDPSRTYNATADKDQKIFIERLANPKSSGYLTALIPINNSNTEFYSIEARKLVGYDNNEIPNSGILIHKINLISNDLNTRIAQVVDNTIDFNPNDAGATWIPGETFVDDINNISVKVIEETKTGFWVIINPTDRYSPPFDFNNSYDKNVGTIINY